LEALTTTITDNGVSAAYFVFFVFPNKIIRIHNIIFQAQL
jgi:hypothetical protein